MKELEAVTYHYTDGTEKKREPWKTGLAKLQEWIDLSYSIEEIKEEAQKAFGKFDGELDIINTYLINTLNLTSEQANDMIDEWGKEWGIDL